MNELVKSKKGNEEIKKRGRRSKNSKEEYKINKEQTKFFVDLEQNKLILEKLFKTLEEVNNKQYGKLITVKDIFIYLVDKISGKDISKIQEASLTEMERVKRHLDEYNKKNSSSIELGEFLVKKLNLA